MNDTLTDIVRLQAKVDDLKRRNYLLTQKIARRDAKIEKLYGRLRRMMLTRPR